MNNEFIIRSIINRAVYLKQRKAECDAFKTDRPRFRKIVELIQIEPSHINEQWIREYVIFWMRDQAIYVDYLKDAFVSKGLRPKKAEKYKIDLARNALLKAKIEKLQKDTGTKTKAIRQYLIMADLNSEADAETFDSSVSEDFRKAEKAIAQRIKRAKTGCHDPLPYPYYGRDVVKTADGIEFIFRDKSVSLKEHLFGDWKYSRKYSNEENSAFIAMVDDITRQVTQS